jgi:tetratricopeptide (TPR) repeat protein
MKNSTPKKEPWLSKLLEQNIVPVLILFIICFALYAPSLKFTYAGDDDLLLIRDKQEFLKNPSNIIEAFKRDAYIMPNNSAFYRPMQTVSYIIDYQFSTRQDDLTPFHISSILIHFLTCYLLYKVLVKLKIFRPLALFCAALFAVHPLFPQAIVWIPGRGDELAGLFCLAATYMYLQYDASSKTKYLISHVLFYLAAVLSKETTVFLPLAIIAYNFLLKKERSVAGKYVLLSMLWGAVIVIFGILRTIGLGTQKPAPGSFGLMAIIKNIPVLPITFGKFFIPHDMATYPLFKTYSIIIGVGVIIAAAVFIYFIKGSRALSLWGISWFLIFSVPPMYMRLSVAEKSIEYFEHRTYLPYIGLIIVLAVLLEYVKPKVTSYIFVSILFVIFLTFGALAYGHEQDYSDRIAFATSAIQSNPDNGFARYQRGTAYIDAKRFEEALNDFNASEANGLITAQLYHSKGVAYYFLGQYQEAISSFTQSLQYEGSTTDTYLARGMTFKLLGNYQPALQDFDLLLSKNVNVYEALIQKGEIFEATGQYELALQNYMVMERIQTNDKFASSKILELQQRITGTANR